MLLNDDSGPKTTFQEDLSALGIAHLFEDDASGAPPTQTVPPKPAEKNGDDEDADKSDDEGEKKPMPKAPPAPAPAPAAESEDSEDDSDDEDEDDGEDMDEETAFDALCNEDARLDAAIDVLDAFYNQLAESEGDDFEREHLVGVIEAFEALTEATGLLDEARIRKGRRAAASKRMMSKRAGRKAHRGGAEMKRERSLRKAGTSGKIAVRGGERIRGREARNLKAISQAQNMFKGHSLKLPGGKNATAMKPIKSSVEEQGSSLTELVDNLTALKESVVSQVDYRRQAEELRDGFNAIGETAASWMTAIAEEVKKSVAEDKDFNADADPRVQIGRHLESIASDAAQVIAMLESGDADLSKVEQDLQSLSDDLHDVAEVMKSVE